MSPGGQNRVSLDSRSIDSLELRQSARPSPVIQCGCQKAATLDLVQKPHMPE